MLGLGVDDMFVIVGTFLEMELKKGRDFPIKDLIKETLVAVGPSITLTSVTNFLGFLLCLVIPLPAFQFFVTEVCNCGYIIIVIIMKLILQVAVAIAFNYIALVVGMPCYLIIDYYRSHGKLMDVLCCIPVWWHKDEDDVDEELNEREKEYGKSGFMKSVYSQISKEYNSVLTWFVVKCYSPILQNYIVKIIILFAYCVVIGICCWGITKTELFPSQSAFGKDDSPIIEYASINEEYSDAIAFAIVTKRIDYPNLQPNLLRMDESIRNLSNVLTPTIANQFWLRVMIEYYQGLQFGLCFADRSGIQEIVTLIISVVRPMHFILEPSCDVVSQSFNKTCLCRFQFFTSAEYRDRNWMIIPPDRFYYYLTLWVSL